MTKVSWKSYSAAFPALGLAAVFLGISIWAPTSKQKTSSESTIQNLNVRSGSARLNARPKVDQIVGIPTPKEAADVRSNLQLRYENDKSWFVRDVVLIRAEFEKVQTSALFSDVKAKEVAVAQAKSAYIKAADGSDAQTLHALAEAYLAAATALDKSWTYSVGEDSEKAPERRATLSAYNGDADLLTRDIDKMHGDSKKELDELEFPLGSIRFVLEDVKDAREAAGLDRYDPPYDESYDSPEAQVSRHRDHLYWTVINLEKMARDARVQ